MPRIKMKNYTENHYGYKKYKDPIVIKSINNEIECHG